MSALTDAMQAAYAPYRDVLFRTNSKAQAESEQALAQARRAWADIVARFAKQPPAPYAKRSQQKFAPNEWPFSGGGM